LTGSKTYHVYTGAETTIFDDPDIGTTISVVPSLDIEIAGNLKGSGDASLTASFTTDANLGVSYDGKNALAGMSEQVSLGDPTVKPNLQLTESDIVFSVIPTVAWHIFLGELVVSGGYYTGAGVLTVITTPITGSYEFTSTFENGQITKSTSTLSLSVSASIDSISVIFDALCSQQKPDKSNDYTCYNYPLLPSPVPSPTVQVSTSSGTQVLGVAASPSPTLAPVTTPPVGTTPDGPPPGVSTLEPSKQPSKEPSAVVTNPTDPITTGSNGGNKGSPTDSTSASLSPGQLTIIVGLALIGGLCLVGFIVYSILLLRKFNKIISIHHDSNEEMYVEDSNSNVKDVSPIGD